MIQDVDIEGLVLKARRLESLTDYSVMFPGTILGKLSLSVQKDILKRLIGLSQTISHTAAIAKEADIGSNMAMTGTIPSQDLGSQIISDFQEKVADVCNSIEGSILLHDDIDLQEAVKDEVAMAAGALDAITLRQHLLDRSHMSDTLEVPRESLKITRCRGGVSKARFRYAKLAGKPVVVERFKYATASSESIEPSDATILALKRVVNLLSHPKRASFHILPCVGYIQERHVKNFGVIYDMEQRSCEGERPVTLHSLYSSKLRAPLGDRIALAYALATALSNFHRVGWVHKELRSEVILFFKKSSTPHEHHSEPDAPNLGVDITQPWLCGFEGSRPEEEESRLLGDFSGETNAYRHPERWGRPTMKFEKSHDVFALVCYTVVSLVDET